MSESFVKALVRAQGRSEFVIVVVADIRGFSSFSTVNESPNIAMFIKRFYLKLINKYFAKARFLKPTGDGLLMTFAYSEDNLLDVSEYVVEACLACLNDFPTICDDDPMINFPIPQAIGFGIARGTACCLHSGEEILDYSGHLLNLASRLNDLARPSGIVVDGNYLLSVIPETNRDKFREQEVYVRSIAEDSPISILYLDKYVEISDASLSPLIGENWQTLTKTFTKTQFVKVAAKWREVLPLPAKSADQIRVTITAPKKGMKGLISYYDFKAFTYHEEGSQPFVRLDINRARTQISASQLSANAKITVRIDYIPKSLPRT